jgi:hypothetical protein
MPQRAIHTGFSLYRPPHTGADSVPISPILQNHILTSRYASVPFQDIDSATTMESSGHAWNGRYNAEEMLVLLACEDESSRLARQDADDDDDDFDCAPAA